ncbi:hypothetical protein [Marinospirillum alkaliphilum]|uniref:Uncharacterized protein n=1 Tax=Marinospirillum alkaliphilum DSM 21637 TaxID=1122209 RepID=A0A1K1VYX9_9GAMM|nr:hypothetical protein [Marinospirillum alkaliphilum]SFX30306.1 hypothetical protein SAMN02745752_01166 [Marinospirillum alkaliphilum DSM 21637]
MNFQRKLLLMVLLILIVVLLIPKGGEDLAPSTGERHVTSEAEMRTVPDTRMASDAGRTESSEATESSHEGDDTPAAEPSLSELPLADSDAQATSVAVTGLTAADLRQFRERGLGDPEQRIMQSLMGRSDLIPQQAVLGGTMRFVAEESLLLNRRWVLATYEDGHIRGQALFEYEVTTTGEILWVLLAHQSD